MKNKFVSMIIAVFYIAFACLADIVISPTSIDYAVGGGGAAIKTSGTGSWTATTDVAWITIVKPSGNAGVSCTYLVSKNNGADTRTGHITIAGNVYTVTQKGCPVTLTPSNINVGKNGTSGVITASMDAGVDWTAEVSDSWITATPNSGSGAAEISYTVETYNEVGSRIGSIRIGSEKFMINQTGIDVTLSPAVTNITKDVCVVPLQVVAMQNTNWEVVPNVTWISVMDAGNGYGGSQVTLAVAENPSFEKRTGTVSIGSAVFTVIQSGTDDVNFKILPEVATASPKGAFANVAVYATPDASWTAESLDSWIKIADGEAGKGNGNVKYVTMSNPELESRTGRIRFSPPVFLPELDLCSGLLFWIEDQANVEGNDLRQMTYPLSKVFDGTFQNSLTGKSLPQKGSHAFSFSFSFKLGALDCINRLLSLSQTRNMYVTVNNELVYVALDSNGAVRKITPTTALIEHANVWYTIVIVQHEDYTVDLYFGEKGSELVRVAKVDEAPIFPMDQNECDISSIVFGRTTYPSAGYLQSGSIANVRFWIRALSETECKKVDIKQDDTIDTYQNGLVGDVPYDYFPVNGNMLYFDEEGEGSPKRPSTQQLNAINWVPTFDKTMKFGYAMSNSGAATIQYSQFENIFPKGCVTNTSLSVSLGDRYYRRKPMSTTCNEDATFNFWIKLDRLPLANERHYLFVRQLSESPTFTQQCSSYGGVDEHHTDVTADKFDLGMIKFNYELRIGVDSNGQIFVSQTDCSLVRQYGDKWYDKYKLVAGSPITETLSSSQLTVGDWHMITVVGKATKSITVYVDGDEIGNVPSQMSFGWIPPIDFTWRCNSSYGDFGCERYASHSYSYFVGPWSGALDEYSIIQSALSSADVLSIYRATPRYEYVHHIVNQGIQEPTITPDRIEVGKLGCSTNIDFEVARAINWTIQPNEPWLSVVGATSGTGPATITIKVAANTECSPRTGTVTIGNKILTINQEALNCVVEAEKTVFPTEADETGGMGFITVSPEGNGSWTATSDVDWIYCFPESGTGSSDVYFFVEDMGSTAASRSGTITIGGQTIEITQRGYDLSIEPCVAEVGGNAGAGVIGVAADADAVWTAIADVPWITIVSAANGYVRYTFTDNTTGETRVGHINISGEEYTLTQTCKLDLNTTIVGQGTVTGGGKYAQGAVVTLRATPASGYEFSHWSGDMVGTEANGTVRMDTVKNVTATFIPEAAAQVLAEKKAAQGGFYTRDQIHALEVGNLVLDVDSASGTARVGVQLMETSDLSDPNSWKPVNMTQGNLDVGNDGTVGLNVKANGNAKFFKVVVPQK